MIWSFERHGRRVRCEVRRRADGQSYEFVITAADGRPEIQLYEDPAQVINQAVEYMRGLIESGYRSASSDVLSQ